MKFYKSDLAFSYGEEEIKQLIPYVMIEVAKEVYGSPLENEVEVSISAMWSLVTKNKRPLAKRERDKLVGLFNIYLQDDTITYETDMKFKLEKNRDDYFITINMSDLNKVFIEVTLAKLPKQLANLLNIQSYLNPKYVYYSLEDLVYEVTKLHESEINWNNTSNWLIKYTYKELEKMANKFVVYPSIECLLTKRHNMDETGLDTKYVTEPNFNTHIAELEELGILCKVNTTYGKHGSKAVFCRVEHKPLCVALYNRMDALKEMAKEYKNEVADEDEVVDEVPTNVFPIDRRSKHVDRSGRRRFERW